MKLRGRFLLPFSLFRNAEKEQVAEGAIGKGGRDVYSNKRCGWRCCCRIAHSLDAQEKPLHSWIAHLEEDAGEIAQILATIVVLAKKVDDKDGILWAVKIGMEGFETLVNLAEPRITILEALLDDVCLSSSSH